MMTRLTQFTLICLLLAAAASPAQGRQGTPREAEQVIFLIDDSSSMTEAAYAPGAAGASRWQLVQQTFPGWLSRLNAQTMVGAVSVGGQCGAPPAISLSAGTERARLLDAVDAASPSGMTNLNAVLQETPGRFDMSVRGGKRIILLSDGENSCAPNGSTCDIARSLHRDYGIVIDVVAWVTNPKMADEFKCVAEVAGGALTTPQSRQELANIPLPVFDPWRYVVLALNVMTFITASTLFYRHAHHALGWGVARASLVAGALLALSIAAAYVTIFALSGVFAALLGACVVAAVLFFAARPRAAAAPAGHGHSPWASLGIALLFVLCAPVKGVSAEAAAAGECKKVVQGEPRYHHILALDVSGSVTSHIEQMKSLLYCYGEMYTLPGEEVTLIAFGRDEQGGVSQLRTFTVPADGSTEILDSLLDDLKVQDPGKTKTYFRPLADFLNGLLPKVHLEPVIMVLSDGLSDGYTDAAKKELPFSEVSFESFGTRGIYTAPGMRDWRVAVQGGEGLDLTALFQRPVAVPKERQNGRRSAAVIQPCLVNPHFAVETDDKLLLSPALNPFDATGRGTLSIRVKNDCASRFRTFKVELRRGAETLPVGEVERALVDEQFRPFTFDVSLPPPADGKLEAAILQLVINQGGVSQTVYAKQPPSISIERTSYLSAYGLQGGLAATGLLALSGLCLVAFRSRRRRETNRPEVVKTLGGPGVPLVRNQPASVGGQGCALAAAGIPDGLVLATAEWKGVRGEIFIQPSAGFRMRVDGRETEGGVYRLGRPLQFNAVQGGESYEVTLYGSTSREIAFSPPPGADVFASGSAFPEPGGIAFHADSAAGVASVRHSDNGIGADSYI
jgi:hypothetical protein